MHIWRVDDFEGSGVDWDQFHVDRPMQLALRTPKQLYEHQEQAIVDVTAGFGDHNRGQMIMACGTGKTFTSLRLAEQLVGAGGSVLFMVPSINLLSQSVREWANDAAVPLATFAVCSDIHAGKRTRDEDMSVNDLAFPASTSPDELVARVAARSEPDAMTVVFATYQSLDVITRAQEQRLGAFDLIVCDEAHRTTGAFRDAGDQSAFTRVHDNAYVAGARRLYMTATPRVYGDQTKAKAQESDVVLASMDDEAMFGPVFHELLFGDAVARNLLTDYRVIVLAVNEEAVDGAFQRQLADPESGLALNDLARIVGCWHALSKRGPQFAGDQVAMQRAVAFSTTIKASQAFTKAFPAIANEALEDRPRRQRGADRGRPHRRHDQRQGPIRGPGVAPGPARAGCLPRALERQMPDGGGRRASARRRAVPPAAQEHRGRRPGRGPGHASLGGQGLRLCDPAGGGAGRRGAGSGAARQQDVSGGLAGAAGAALPRRAPGRRDQQDRPQRYFVDDQLHRGRLDGGDRPDEPGVTTTADDLDTAQLAFPDLGEWRDALYARIVEKVGDRRYMEHWAEDISQIAAAQEIRIRGLVEHPGQNPGAVARFDEFLTALSTTSTIP